MAAGAFQLRIAAMPVHYLRALTSPGRTTENNRRLGRSLAFVAGAANAGGFLAVGQYTSHMTGVVTDIGIELGKLLYWNARDPARADARVLADRPRLHLLASLLGMFLLGGLAGALGFKHMGFIATVPLAALLAVLAIVPVFDDLATLGRRS